MDNVCTKCSGNPVYFRRYSGERLCSECFSSSIIEKARKTIKKHKMLKYGEKIAVGVSGGKDSLALLDILIKMQRENEYELVAITIDEGIKNYREEAVELAIKACEKYDVEHVNMSFRELFGFTLDNVLENRNDVKNTSCSICGPLRRRGIELAAKKIGVNTIATGHNLDDMLQTFMINLLSGDVYRIKQSKPYSMPKEGFEFKKIKPFMEIYENEIAFYSFQNNLPFQSTDCPHMNENIRNELRDVVNNLEKNHPGIKFSLMKSMEDITENIELKPKKLVTCLVCGNSSSSSPCSVCKTISLSEKLTKSNS
ncbi:MAG: TIGR00269 family protein [Thaumarchaeota archaeon]|jgi:uncharacterized protein (TIGR00269 family)|nr:TIGR00269 family protein [Nitrososphaerota archaeon]